MSAAWRSRSAPPAARSSWRNGAGPRSRESGSRSMADPWVHDFADGSADMRSLLGGKGANLAEMTRIGLPVPDGFTITTEACIAFLREGGRPEGLNEQVADALARLEQRTGKRLGAAAEPLLVSVRSGAAFSMP